MPYGVVCNLPYIDGWMGGHFCILKLVSRKSCQHINKKLLCPYNLVDFTLKTVVVAVEITHGFIPIC